MKALVDFDRLKLDEKLKTPDEASGANKIAVAERVPRQQSEKVSEKVAEKPRDKSEDKPKSQEPEKPQEDAAGSDSEYEEIEVTDDEDEEGGALLKPKMGLSSSTKTI
jgi:hypothetical protein